MVTATVDDDLLGKCLLVPPLIRDQIREETVTSVEYRDRIIDYYLHYSPYATWNDLAGLLYSRDCLEAVALARSFIKKIPGKRMYTI